MDERVKKETHYIHKDLGLADSNATRPPEEGDPFYEKWSGEIDDYMQKVAAFDEWCLVNGECSEP